MERKSLTINTVATGDICIIPDQSVKLKCLPASVKEGVCNTAFTNGLVLNDDDNVVRVSIRSVDLHSSNCANYGLVIHSASAGDFKIASSLTSPAMEYLPARLLKDVKEGVPFTVIFRFCCNNGNRIDAKIEMNLTPAQLEFDPYASDRFENVFRQIVGSMEPEQRCHTMRKFMEFIQTAQCDDFGYCYPFSDDGKRIRLHIYNTKHQVNIAIDGRTVVNLLFGENEVGIVKVTNEIADYDNILRVKMDTSMELVQLTLENVIGQEDTFSVKNIIIDAIDQIERSTRLVSKEVAAKVRNVLHGAYDDISKILEEYSDTLSDASTDWIRSTLEHIKLDKEVAIARME